MGRKRNWCVLLLVACGTILLLMQLSKPPPPAAVAHQAPSPGHRSREHLAGVAHAWTSALVSQLQSKHRLINSELRGHPCKGRKHSCHLKLSTFEQAGAIVTPSQPQWGQLELVRAELLSRLPPRMSIALTKEDRLSRLERGSAPAAVVVCPAIKEIHFDGHKADPKYKHRAQLCNTSRTMWYKDMRCPTFCKTISVGLIMGYAPGDVVFDWGSGCGTAFLWLEKVFGVRTTGHELTPIGAEFSMVTTGAVGVCAGDGYDMRHVHSASVDHIISNAAVYHLEPKMQCAIVSEQFMRVLRPGGSAWIGFNGLPGERAHEGDNAFPVKEWEACLSLVPGIQYAVVSEKQVFGDSEYVHEKTFSVLLYKERDT